jgi:hypothetical protein
MCINTKINYGGEIKKWDTEEGHILVNGQVMDHTVIYPHGKDQDECTAAEAMDDDGPSTHEHVQCFRGVQDGGGQTQRMRINLQLHKRK